MSGRRNKIGIVKDVPKNQFLGYLNKEGVWKLGSHICLQAHGIISVISVILPLLKTLPSLSL